MSDFKSRFVPPYEMGNYSYVGEFCHISQHTKIGRYCSIANLVTVGAQPHRMDILTTFTPFAVPNDFSIAARTTIIGHDVWIGSSVVILAGVTIGTGAVIGASSVVTKNVEPYAIVFGNPARLSKFRFGAAARDALLKSAWWELPADAVKRLPPLFPDFEACIQAIQRARAPAS